jgi:hypothetical protein
MFIYTFTNTLAHLACSSICKKNVLNHHLADDLSLSSLLLLARPLLDSDFGSSERFLETDFVVLTTDEADTLEGLL